MAPGISRLWFFVGLSGDSVWLEKDFYWVFNVRRIEITREILNLEFMAALRVSSIPLFSSGLAIDGCALGAEVDLIGI